MAAYSTFSDTELFDLFKSGDHAAYKEIYNRYYAALYIHAFKRLQEREECRDIIQELFTNLWLKRAETELSGQLSGYLYTSVRNRIFDLLARKKLKSSYLNSIQEFAATNHITADHRIRQNQLTAIIEQEIQALPTRTREIFELSRKGHFTHREIAEQLDISEQTVKTTVNNALKVLRVKLGTMFFLL
ncbi:RNA polymerase sigma-70 factor (ECF subfamily) [Mucilaginibacter gracilis]|uniref:RNA polymerase sigma-70 factor (ECF subfamily) n=1 Tax=Mucilaginibacter gracilis TaxID=423350 RepID=A0A495IUS9_9SPHI|nr:RNA polymerase sigma-70 factor [Mucilaginibacter gracilis]RKR80061.1 RNA polymerase sigma-70 factor (ECF subfamily) [Mucilaginibacter gracilis]